MLRKLPGVYAPQDDSALLLEVLGRVQTARHAHVLDIGTGTGVLACAAARAGALSVTAVDVSQRAVLTTRVNALLGGLRVRAVRGDLFEPVKGRQFDLVLANPPYVPSPQPDLPTRGPQRAWDAGHDGRAILDRLCAGAGALLRRGGSMLLVHSEICGAERTVQLLKRVGLRCEVVERRDTPFGPVMRGRLDWLRAQGLVRPEEHREGLVVIRAEHA